MAANDSMGLHFKFAGLHLIRAHRGNMKERKYVLKNCRYICITQVNSYDICLPHNWRPKINIDL